MARKPKNYRAELEEIEGKLKVVKARQTVELGRMVQATGADRLDPEVLVGILVSGVRAAAEEKAREAWRSDGTAFFRKRDRRKTSGADHGVGDGAEAPSSGEAQG